MFISAKKFQVKEHYKKIMSHCVMCNITVFFVHTSYNYKLILAAVEKSEFAKYDFCIALICMNKSIVVIKLFCVEISYCPV